MSETLIDPGKAKAIIEDETFQALWDKMEKDHTELAIYAKDGVSRADATRCVRIIRDFREQLSTNANSVLVHKKTAVA